MSSPRTLAVCALAALAGPALAQQLEITGETLFDNDALGGIVGRSGWFGHEVAWLDDLDGNGVQDIAVGAHNHDSVYILFLESDRSVAGATIINGRAVDAQGGSFGNSLATIDDIDGDGIRELAVSAPRQEEGRVYILFLNSDGTQRDHVTIGHNRGGFGDLDVGDVFGGWISNVGDFTGDGRSEMAVSAARDDDGGTDRGAVYLLSLGEDGEVERSWKYSAVDAPLAGFLADGSRFGTSVSSAGDLDGDGIDELAAGPYVDADLGFKGSLFILYLDESLDLRRVSRIAEGAGGLDASMAPLEQFGFSVAPAGDLDRDGTADLFVGAPGNEATNGHTGGVWALLMRANGTVHDHVLITDGLAGFNGPLPASSAFGATVTRPIDFNGDGISEFAVGAPTHRDDQGNQYGAFWILEFSRGCFADREGDGVIDARDFFVFLEEFVAANTSADLNGDGVHDQADFFAYLDLFTSACD